MSQFVSSIVRGFYSENVHWNITLKAWYATVGTNAPRPDDPKPLGNALELHRAALSSNALLYLKKLALDLLR